MMTVKKNSIFPANRNEVFQQLQKIETLQFVAAPFASFKPVNDEQALVWEEGTEASFYFKLFSFIPFAVHTIKIEKFDENSGIVSKESNRYVPVWNHHISLGYIDEQHTEYTDIVEIEAGWQTIFVYLWACCFYSHRQRKWIKLLTHS